MAEAARTELANLASLEVLVAQEEESKRSALAKKARELGPALKWRSRIVNGEERVGRVGFMFAFIRWTFSPCGIRTGAMLMGQLGLQLVIMQYSAPNHHWNSVKLPLGLAARQIPRTLQMLHHSSTMRKGTPQAAEN